MAYDRLPANCQLYAMGADPIPLLQHAILKDNEESVDHLIKKKVNIVFKDQTGVLILYEDQTIPQLRLEILSIKLNDSLSGKEYFAGFKSKSNGWILTKLPDLREPEKRPHLTQFEILGKDSIKHRSSTSSNALKTIVQCRCPKILDIAFQRGIIDPINDSTFSLFIAENGSEELTIHFLTLYPWNLFLGNDGKNSMIESALCNPNVKVLGALLNSLPPVIKQSLPYGHTNSITTQDKQISQCLYNSLRLSLDCEGIQPLEKLINHQLKDCGIVKFNYFYEEKCNTLIQLVVIKQLKPIFLRVILSMLQKITNEEYTHIICEMESSLVPLIDSINKDHNTALHQVVLSEQEELLDCLLVYNPSLLIQDKDKNTALHLAVIKKHLAIVEKLVAKATNSNELLEARDSYECTALHLAIDNFVVLQNRELNFAIPKSLLGSKANFYAKGYQGYTILHHAILLEKEYFRTETINFLLDYERDNLLGKILHCTKDNYPLHFAIDRLFPDVVELLLTRDPTVLIDLKENHQIALHVVIINFINSSNQRKNRQIFDLLLKAIKQQENLNEDYSWQDKRVICYQDVNGRTPLHLSVEFLNFYALQELLASSPCLDRADKMGNTILHQTVLQPQYLEYLQEVLQSIQSRFSNQLHEYHYTKNFELIPPLQLAIKQNNIPCIEVLIKEKIQLGSKYPHPNGYLTLCDGISNFSLNFFAEEHTHVNANSETSYFTGYKSNYKGDEYLVLSQLPDLNTTWLFKGSQCVELSGQSIEQCLRCILECKSQDPLRAVFRKILLEPRQRLSNGLFMGQFVSQHATKEVMEYYLTQHTETLFFFKEPNYRSMIESSICNPELDTIELLLKTLDTIDNTHELPEVKECLHRSLEISLVNEGPGAMSLLLKYNSKRNDTYGENNESLLYLIIKNDKNHSFISCLLDKVDPTDHSIHIDNTPLIDAKNLDSKSPLHLVIEMKNLTNLRELLKYKPSLNAKDSFGDTALHYAVFMEDLQIVKEIVSAIKMAVKEIESSIKMEQLFELMNLSNNEGSTALHLAVHLGNIEIAEYLLNEGCDCLARDKSGQTMLHYAVRIPSADRTCSPMVEFILKHDGICHNYANLKSKNNDERTPLHTAVIEDHQLIIKHLIDAIKIAEEKFDDSWISDRVLCYQDCEKKTALHLCVERGNCVALEYLLSTGPCLHLNDKDRNTILHTATIDPTDEISIGEVLKSIQSRFPDHFEDYLYDRINVEKLTPLQFAIKNAHFKAVNTLVKSYQVSIVYERPIGTITLNFNEILPPTFFRSLNNDEFYIGYSFTPKLGYKDGQVTFVVCQLPLRFDNLSHTKITDVSEIEEISIINCDRELRECLLKAILKSQSSEPLKAYHNISQLTTDADLSNSSTLMHFAAEYGTEQVIAFLFDQLTFDFTETDGDRNGLFHRAVFNEIENVIFLLHNIGDITAIINIKNKRGLRPLDVALLEDMFDVFLQYIKMENQAVLNYYDPNRNTLIHNIVSDIDKTEKCLEIFLEEVKMREVKNSESTSIDLVPMIDCRSQTNLERYTALHLSIIKKNYIALDLLYRYEANLNLPTLNCGFSIVHLAIFYRLEESQYFQRVLEMTFPRNCPLFNSQDTRGYLWPIKTEWPSEVKPGPLVLARTISDVFCCLHGNVGWGLDLWSIVSSCGYSPLHLVISFGKSCFVEYLLNNLNNPPNDECKHESNTQLFVRDPEGYTPLHYATLLQTSEAINIIRLLFNAETMRKIINNSILTQRCNEGKTPLHTALSKANFSNKDESSINIAFDILQQILEYTHKHEDTETSQLDSIAHLDCYNRSILHHAVITNNNRIISRVLKELTTQDKQDLNRFGRILLDLQDYDGNTALHITVENNNYDAFKELMMYKPLLDLRNKKNHWTVLHCIIDCGSSPEFLDDTIEAVGTGNVILNILDVNGFSPLHLAIERNNLWAVDKLVDSKANLLVELGEVGCDTYTVGTSVKKDYLMLGKTENTEENFTQIEEYIVAFKHGNIFLVSTLPELKDVRKLEEKDVEFTFSEPLVRACLGSKCPELIAKLLEDYQNKFDTLGIRLMHLAGQWASKPVMKYLCEKVQPQFDFESLDNYGNTLIHCAAMNRKENLKTLKYILRMTEEFQKNQNINQKIIKLRNYKGQTALQISINDKKYTFFMALIKRGANIEQRNQDGNGIIHILLEKQSKEDDKPYDIIKFLIDEITKSEKLVHKLSNFLNIKNNKGLTALQISIKSSYKDIVKLLIDNNASLCEIDPKSGNTIVHLATSNERNDCNVELFNTVIKAVKTRDKDRYSNTILNRKNNDQNTPLHISVRGKEKIFMTKSLLDAGVPLEICDRDKNTALHIATENKDEETVKIIMQHLIKRGREYRLADRGLEYMRELIRANKKKQIPVCIPTSPSILKSMLQAWNHFYYVNFGEGRRGFLIHLAVFEQNISLVKGIVDGMKEREKHLESGSRELVGNILSSRDNEDLTPLHIAAEKGNAQIARILIVAGADIQLNSAKGTSFEVAMQKDCTELALYLVGEGANIDKYPNLLAYDKISNQYIQDEILAKGKVNLRRRISSADCTVIHYAAKQSSVSRISFLLSNGIALTPSDRDGRRVLHYAIQYRDNFDVLKFFLDEATRRDELDKDPSNHMTYIEALMRRDLDGITPVMLAASLDRIEFFKLLITPNYDYLLETFDTRDPDENNVIHYLANNKSIHAAQLIVPHIQKTNIELFTRIMNGRNVAGHSPIDLARKRGMQEMVDLFVDLCDLEYFEACPDVVHRMFRDRDYDNFSKVLDKAVIVDSRNVQVATKLLDSNEEGDYPNLAFFNFNLASLWHKLYRSDVVKFKYHPIVKFLIEEKLTVYRLWFIALFFFYLILFYFPLITALFLASLKCDSELFLYNTNTDRFRFCLEMYILMFTWLFMINEGLEIEGKWRFIRNLSFTSRELNYRRQHQVRYYGHSEQNKHRKLIQSTVKFVFYKLPILVHKRLFDFDRKHRFILRAVYKHLTETYNVIDMCSIVSLIILFFFRSILFYTHSSTLSVLHWTVSALTFSLFTFKFYKYTKIFPSLGIYIETLSNVLSTDVPRFTLVIVLLLLSYVGSIQLVARSYCLYDGGQCSFSDWFGDSSVPFSSFTTPFISGLLFIIDGGPGNYEGSFREVPLIFSIFYLVFAFCIIVVLLNVFIAQLSQTYANIYSTKNLHDFKADLTLEYETQSSVLFKFDCPIRRPLKRITVQSIIIPLETWKSYFRSYNQRIGDSPEGTEAENEKPSNIKELHPLIDEIESRIQSNIKELIPILRNELDMRTKEIIQQHT